MTRTALLELMPIIITATAALLVLLAGPFLKQRTLSALAFAAPAAAGVWAALLPAGRTPALPGLFFSPLARFLVPVLCFSGALTALLSHGYNSRRELKGEEFPATLLFALFAMCVLPYSTNLLVLFLALESIAFAFYIMVASDLTRAASGEAGIKYLLSGAVAAAITAFGISFFYLGSGSLELAARPGAPVPLSAVAGWGLVLLGLSFKLSLVPGHLWTPDVYQGAPAPVAGFLSTGSKVAALGFLLLLLSLMPPIGELHAPLYLLSLLSMVLGNLAALLQQDLKRMLGYSSIAHMGYLALAILTGSLEGYAAVLTYAAIYSAMNLAAFGAVASLSGREERSHLSDYDGLGYRAPLRAGVLALSMLALAGIPPTAGFIGKFFIFYSALAGGETVLAVVGIVSAAASAFFYLRVVSHLYMRHEANPAPQEATLAEGAALSLCALALVVLGLFPAPLLKAVDAALR